MVAEDVKVAVRDRLHRAYQIGGLDCFLSTATRMLGVNTHGNLEIKAQVVGEVCEQVLCQLTDVFIETAGVQARYYKSVILKDLYDPFGSFRTELDFVLVTPSFILTTECKSYSGDIEIHAPCKIVGADKEADVWKQSKLHFDKLYAYAEEVALPHLGLPKLPVFANAFVFSNASISDKRLKEQQAKLRVLTASTLIQYYKALFMKYRRKVYDFERLCRIMEFAANSKKLHAQHKEYLGYK